MKTLTLFLALISTISFAQQSRVDSVITLLKKCKTAKGLDTLTLNKAWGLIENTLLTDAQISQIEKASAKFNNGNDEDICYNSKFYILLSLITSDKNKAIDYGRLNIKKLENSKTPHVEFLKQWFLEFLRIPYRNSVRLPEGFKFYSEKLNNYKTNNDSLGISDCHHVLSGFYRTIGLMEPTLYHLKKSISYLDTNKRVPQYFLGQPFDNKRTQWFNNTGNLVEIYLITGDYQQSIKYSSIVLKEDKPNYNPYTLKNLAEAYLLANQLDSVTYLLDLAKKLSTQFNPPVYEDLPTILQVESLYNIKIGHLQQADSLLQQCWKLIHEQNIDVNTRSGFIDPDYYLALVRIKQNRFNDAIELLNKDIVRVKNIRPAVLRDYRLLAEMYEKTGHNTKAKKTYRSFISLQDSVLADQAKYRTISFELEQQMNENELSISKLQNDNKISALTRNFSFVIAALLSLLAIGLYFRFKSKQKANNVLQGKNEEIQSTLSKLKATQAQLIQKEKLASLGELTAGIAHEIQNPLNFVNNFSEMSVELIEELKSPLTPDGGIREGEKVDMELLDDVVTNLEKINHHGKRASSIVSGMLEHSRTSTGERALTDINKLADEYLRLSYHGMRAKNTNGSAARFNADYELIADENLPLINVVPQDMGRVLLNLINNAFYAVWQRNNVETLHATSLQPKYQPRLKVSTHHSNGHIIIKIQDNGSGIPAHILPKIFQPFFTTKPTGEGTGLGLSLAYDIVTKGHGGAIEVESVEGEGAEFVIQLPI